MEHVCSILLERLRQRFLLTGRRYQLLAEQLGISEGGIAADPACRRHAVNSVADQGDVRALPRRNGSGDAQRGRDDRALLGQADQVSQRGMLAVDHGLSNLEPSADLCHRSPWS